MNLEEIKEKATAEGMFRASQHNYNQAEAGYNAKWFKRGAIFGAELQSKTMYSEEEVYNILQEHTVELFKGEPCTLHEFWNKFKKNKL
jgi:hypothetical protein